MMTTNDQLIRRLMKPAEIVDAVLDTDTYNEIDDQFALAYLIRSPDKIRLRAIYAAPFLNQKSADPGDGMEKSREEIFKVLAVMEREDLKSLVYSGSRQFLSDEETPVQSEAARHLCRLAMEYTPEKPLYVIAIGAITNVASALLLKPEIKERIVIVWLGGHAHDWDDNTEFNLYQDVASARVVFGCGAALVQLPCMGVVSAFTTSEPELRHWLKGKNKLCDYLYENTVRQARLEGQPKCWTRAIWDVTAVGWLTGDFMRDRLEPSPIPEYDHHYGFDRRRHLIRYVYHIDRDRLFEDLFDKLTGSL